MTQASDSETRTWGMFCHLSALSLFLGIPLGNVLGPLIIWLCRKKEIPYVDEQGRKALNFQISITIYAVGVGLLAFLLSFIFVGVFLMPLVLVLFVFDLVLTIIAGIKTANGEPFEYLLAINFIK